MDKIELTEIESLKASRHFAELRMAKFTLEALDAQKEMLESDLSLAQQRVEYLKSAVATTLANKTTLQGLVDNSTKCLTEVFEELKLRLDPSIDLEHYVVQTNEQGNVAFLTKE